MKEGWEYKKLGDVANFISGYTPNKEEISNQGKYPYFKVAEMNIAGNELFMRNTSLFVNSPKRIYPKGSIIFPKNGGAIYTEKKRILEVDSVIDLNTEAIFPTAQVELMYLFFLLTFTKISSFDKGGGLPSLDIKKMSESIIPVPPLSEQQSIVEYLDSAFAKIDAMKANAEKALNEAKALFQASLKEMLEPKEGWEEKTLGNIAEDSADGPFGSNLKKEHYTTKKEVRIIQLSNIGEDGWREENTKYTTFEHLKNISRSEVEPNDIVIAKMMPAGRAILCPSHEAKFVLSSDAVKIKLKKGMLTRFILHSINSPYFRNEVYENVTGSGRVRTSLTKLRACSVYLPSLEVQQTIVDTLDSIKSKVNRLQENYDKISQECDALKQAILRQVFE